MANGIDLKRAMPTDPSTDKMFRALGMVGDKMAIGEAAKAGGEVIVRRAKALAPRSTPEMRAKRSKKQQASADWNYPLWKSINQITRQGKFASVSVIGPEWPKGNKAYFNTSPNGRRQVFWGKPTGRVVPQIRNFIVQAADETKQQQLAAIKASLQQSMRNIFGG